MGSLMDQLSASSKQIRETRVKNFAASAVANSSALIESKRSDIREIENRLATIFDIAPTSTLDLSSKLSGVDSAQMMKEVHQLKVQLEEERRVLDIMLDTHNELFPENKETRDKYNIEVTLPVEEEEGKKSSKKADKK